MTDKIESLKRELEQETLKEILVEKINGISKECAVIKKEIFSLTTNNREEVRNYKDAVEKLSTEIGLTKIQKDKKESQSPKETYYLVCSHVTKKSNEKIRFRHPILPFSLESTINEREELFWDGDDYDDNTKYSVYANLVYEIGGK